MDGRRFDDLTRTLGAEASRRRVLAGLAAAAFGALGVGRARAQPGPGEPCGSAICRPGEFCCNESCGTCAPIGGACTLERCADPPTVPCGPNTCGPGEFCCNPSCGVCAPLGGACTLEACAEPPGEPCNAVTCGPGEFCCNPSCSTCAPVGGACTAQLCGPGGGGFAVGAGVVTTAALNYRVEPSLGAAIIAVLAAGTRGAILDGPVAADGYGWYRLGVAGHGPDGAAPGWVAGEYLAPG